MNDYEDLINSVSDCNMEFFNQIRDEVINKSANENWYKMLSFNNYEVFIKASNSGCIEIVKCILKDIPKMQRNQMISINNYEALMCAISNHHLEMVKIILDNMSADSKIDWINKGAEIAMEYGFNDIVEVLLSYCKNDEEKDKILQKAANLGIIEGSHEV